MEKHVYKIQLQKQSSPGSSISYELAFSSSSLGLTLPGGEMHSNHKLHTPFHLYPTNSFNEFYPHLR